MNLAALRSIEWCPSGLTNAQGQLVQRYLIIGGSADGGPFEKERAGQKFPLYAWTGGGADPPVKLIDDLRPYAVQPEGLDLISLQGETRVLFLEDRYWAGGYGTRNAIHWPVAILGSVP